VLQNRFFRSAAFGVATLVAAGTVSMLGATAASAASIGTLTLNETTGFSTDGLTFNTSADCPSGDNIQVTIAGGLFPAAENLDTSAAPGIYPASPQGGYAIPAQQTILALADIDETTPNLDPTNPTEYTIDAECVSLFGGVDGGDFSTNIWFTSATAFTTVNPSQPVTATTTTLTAVPAGTAEVGSSVTFTAAVAPAAAAGTVQFLEGTTVLGSETVSGTGTNTTAGFATTALGIGTQPITAVFTPSSPATYGGSTSAVTSYVITAAPATVTSTSLLVTPGSTAPQYTQVSLSASISPTTATGTVQFLDGTTALGSLPVVGGGTPSSDTVTYNTSALGLGTHNFTAVFTPTDPTSYVTSTSAVVPFQVTAFQGTSATETITTTVAPGSLVISVPNGQVALPSPVLNANGTLFQTSGALQPITVTDNRAGNPGWTVSGLVALPFSDGTTTINAENLGWTPTAATGSPGQTIVLGPNVAPANGVAPGVSTGLGLATSQTLATTAPGFGLGTAQLGANINLNVPTTTTAGTYTATLTLTAI